MQLSRFDIAAINAARDSLQQIETDARSAVWGAPNQVRVEETAYSHDYGMLIARAETAADALFQVLCCAQINCLLPVTDDDLYNREPTEEEDEGDGREPDGQRQVEGHIVPTDR